ncbi:MAG: FkbM family methyltransferase [Alteraurantiacibacter sp.]
MHQSKLDDFAAQAMTADKSRRLGMVPGDHLHEALQLLPESPSQLNQDFFALSATDWRRGGYFVEFGATDGRTLSNTWLLEKHFGWTGILAEPGRVWRDKLRAADRTAARDFDCVWERSGDTLQFHEDSVGEFSTLESHKHMDSHTRDHGSSYAVTTVSLRDLLDRHQAPAVIDFLSIDTEGSELQILTAYDFSRPIRAIAVEHNYTPNRVAIHGLLTAKGYLRQFEDLSEFDDWYVLAA